MAPSKHHFNTTKMTLAILKKMENAMPEPLTERSIRNILKQINVVSKDSYEVTVVVASSNFLSDKDAQKIVEHIETVGWKYNPH